MSRAGKRRSLNSNSHSVPANVPEPKSRVRHQLPKKSILAKLADFVSPVPKRQRRAARLRATLIKATAQKLRTTRLEDISMLTLSRDTGCSVGALYGHFASRQALIEAALRRTLNEELSIAQSAFSQIAANSSSSRNQNQDQILHAALHPFRAENNELIRSALLVGLLNPGPGNAISGLRDSLFKAIDIAFASIKRERQGGKATAILKNQVDAAAIAIALKPRN